MIIRSPFKRILQVAPTLIVAVCVAAAPLLTWRDPTLWGYLRVWWIGDAARATAAWHRSERIFDQAASTKSDVALVFNDFDENDHRQWELITNVYAMGNYALYPRKVIAAPEGGIVNGAAQIVPSHFSPSTEWLQQRNVWAMVTVTSTGGANVDFHTTSVAAPFRPLQLPIEGNR